MEDHVHAECKTMVLASINGMWCIKTQLCGNNKAMRVNEIKSTKSTSSCDGKAGSQRL